MRAPPTIWTIGHSNHSFERLASLLRGEDVEFVVDVRSYPYSRVAPHFGREPLDAALGAIGIRYLFLGDRLGGRPTREDHYDEQGHALYSRMAEEPQFRAAIERLSSGCRQHHIALLCSEGQPEQCHRRLLVGKVLAEDGIQLRHILPTGAVHREESVCLDSQHGQEALFGEAAAWRSTQSVSHRRRLSTSSVV